MLVSKYQDAGFEGSGWWLDAQRWGPLSDARIADFSRFAYDGNGMYWQIVSRTSSIPASGEGNVPYLLASGDSVDYNVLWYHQMEYLVLDVDNTNLVEEYYTRDDLYKFFDGQDMEIAMRMPPKVFWAFGWNSDGELCDDETKSACDVNGDEIYDETIVTWILRGHYDTGGTTYQYDILPKTSVFYNQRPSPVDVLYDSNIRESVVNSQIYPNIIFSNAMNYNPIVAYQSLSQISGHSVISEQADVLREVRFGDLFADSRWYLSLQLNQLLQSKGGQIYPFLEYRVDVQGGSMPDRFFRLYGYGQVGNYTVKIVVKKPSFGEGAVGDFTIIF